MSEDPRFLAAWADNALAEVRAVKSIPALDDFIVANHQRLGNCEQYANSAWTRLRDAMHARDGELRALRQGVG